MRNHEQFVVNSLKILLCDIQRIKAVCTHADLAVAGPGVEVVGFNDRAHTALTAIAYHADMAIDTLADFIKRNDGNAMP